MDRAAVIRAALRALGRNKLRTALTLLGITIGISAVICTVAIGEGGSNRIHEQLLLLGDNFVWVEAGGRNVNGVRTGTGHQDAHTCGHESHPSELSHHQGLLAPGGQPDSGCVWEPE